MTAFSDLISCMLADNSSYLDGLAVDSLLKLSGVDLAAGMCRLPSGLGSSSFLLMHASFGDWFMSSWKQSALWLMWEISKWWYYRHGIIPYMVISFQRIWLTGLFLSEMGKFENDLTLKNNLKVNCVFYTFNGFAFAFLTFEYELCSKIFQKVHHCFVIISLFSGRGSETPEASALPGPAGVTSTQRELWKTQRAWLYNMIFPMCAKRRFIEYYIFLPLLYSLW